MKIEVLPAMIEWAKQRNHPFNYITELTITLADDEELMALMTEAGFTIVFIGIETPSEEGLIECNKVANTGRDLMAMVKKIMNHGLEVYGGFVIGFDSDDATIFERQIDFIQKSGIIVAMVSLLMALPGTRLYERLERENRLIGESHGDNLDFTLNFVPKMDYLTLVDGYRNVLDTIYSPKRYYERMQAFYQEYRLPEAQGSQSTRVYYTSLVKLLWILGFAEKGRSYFWRLLMVTIFKRPRLFALCLRRSLYRLHLARMTRRFGAAVAAYKETAPMA
jgi:radical SAM superfamily enzyme YgiQ (UPF0313 family)